MQNFSSYFNACRRKVRKTVYFRDSKLKKGHYSNKNWRKLMTLKLDRMFMRRKWHTKFQLNMSKHVGEKCGNLWLTDIAILKYFLSEDGRVKRKVTTQKRHQNVRLHNACGRSVEVTTSTKLVWIKPVCGPNPSNSPYQPYNQKELQLKFTNPYLTHSHHSLQ